MMLRLTAKPPRCAHLPGSCYLLLLALVLLLQVAGSPGRPACVHATCDTMQMGRLQTIFNGLQLTHSQLNIANQDTLTAASKRSRRSYIPVNIRLAMPSSRSAHLLRISTHGAVVMHLA